MAEPQATREKEEARRKLLLLASHLIIDLKEIFAVSPVVLGLASVCSKILNCSVRENGNFGDAEIHYLLEGKTMEELSSVSSLLGMGKI